ncbi:MAG: hypothetical protein AVDCRST_MAG74-3296 [uncultured Pyrinomonadaceae bacterium]|uniref:Uncharacterized protein n=1 Tax=uncultured Pyrinomonadaceae bacterium TaxID=2283094 RepID=A0A6J4PWV9_9BACT|nr:MAG: hypothetical protein AVDCRST_MAG74-3296 [uncultured Pyrinomonadaceae bacterium]
MSAFNRRRSLAEKFCKSNSNRISFGFIPNCSDVNDMVLEKIISITIISRQPLKNARLIFRHVYCQL